MPLEPGLGLGLGLGAGVVGALLGPPPLLAEEPPTPDVGSLTSGVAGSSVRLQAHASASQFNVSAAKAIRDENPKSRPGITELLAAPGLPSKTHRSYLGSSRAGLRDR
jgi:hypothetical protein